MDTTKPTQTNQLKKEASQLLTHLQALQEVNLELSRTTSLEELCRKAIELGRSRLGFDRLGLLLYHEATNTMLGTFGTDTQGHIRDEHNFQQIVEEPKHLEILTSKEKISFWEDVKLRDKGEVVGTGWNAIAVLWSGEKGLGWLAADNLLTHEPLNAHQLDILQLYGANLGHLILVKQLEQQQQNRLDHRTRQVEISTQVAQAIAAATNLESLYQRVVTEIKEQFDYYHTQLLRYNPELDAVELIAGYGDIGEQMLAAKHQTPRGEGPIGTAATTGRSVLCPNLLNDPDWTPAPLLPETKGEIAVPIKLEDEILGVLDVQSDTPDALTNNDQLLLEGLCGQIAVAINTTRLTEERRQTEEALQKSQETLQNTLKRQQALHRVSLELSSIQDPDELYQQVILKGQERLGLDRIGLYLMDAEAEALVGTFGVDRQGNVHSIKDHKLFFSQGDWVKNFIYNEDRLIANEHTELLHEREVIGYGWYFSAAMWIRDIPIGVMFADNLVSQQPYEPHLPELITAYSTDVANLINRLHSEQRLREREQTIQDFLKKQQELHEISIQLSNHDSLEMLFQEAIMLAQSKLGFSRIGLYLYDPDKDMAHGTYGVGVDGKLRHEYHLVHQVGQDPWMQRFLYHGERLEVNEDAPLYEDGEVVGHGWNVTAAVWQADQPIGLLSADNLLDQKPLETYQPELLTALGATIASQIRRIQDELQRREAEAAIVRQAADLQTVADLSTQITSIQSPQALMETIVQETQKRFDLYHCRIFLVDESGKNLRIHACGWHPEAAQHGTHGDAIIAIDAQQSLVAQVARSKRPVVINDVLNAPNWLPHKLLPHTRSELAIPMIVGDTVVGVFDVLSSRKDRFDSDDVKIQMTLAAQTAVALENARSIARSEEVIQEMNELTRRLTRESWREYLTDLEEKDTEIVYQAGEFNSVEPEISEADTQETAVTSSSYLSQSLLVHGEPIGHLSVFNDEDTPEIEGDAAIMMSAIAEQLSARVENIRLTEQTQQALAITQDQAQRLGLLNEISAEMSNVETLEQVFAVIFNRIPALLNVDRVSLTMLRPDKKSLEIVGYEGEEVGEPTGTIIPLSGTIMEQAINENRVLSTEIPRSDSIILSSMVAPLFTAGRQAIGTLNIGSKKPHALTDRDHTLMQQLATMLSSVIENKQLLAKTQERAAQLETLSHVEVALSQANSEEEILRSIMPGFNLVNATAIALHYLNYQPDGVITLDMFSFVSNGHCLVDDVLTRATDIPLAASPLTPLWQDNPNAITYITDIRNHEKANEQLLEHAQKSDWLSGVIMPLKRGGDVQALLCLTWKAPHEFTETEQFVSERLLEPVSAVVSSRRAQLAQQEALAETASLYRASAEMNAAQTYEDILSVVRKYTIAGRADVSVSFSMFDRPWLKNQMPEYIEMQTYFTTRENVPIPTRFPLEEFPAASQVLKPDEPTVIADLEDPDLVIDEHIRALYTKVFGAKAVIFSPLVVGGQWIGYINVLYGHKTSFSEASIRRLTSISGQSAVAVQNLGLLEETSRKAQREKLLREITDQVRRSADIDTILKTAVQQIGHALGRKTFISLEISDVKPATAPLGDKNGTQHEQTQDT